MNLKQKAKDNRKLANQYYSDDTNYDVATNRYYYSCFQKLLYFSNEKLNYSRDEDKGTHQSLIDFVDDYITENLYNIDFSSLAKIKDIKSDYDFLKKCRVKADYQDKNITKDEIDKVKDRVSKFDEKLGIIKNYVR